MVSRETKNLRRPKGTKPGPWETIGDGGGFWRVMYAERSDVLRSLATVYAYKDARLIAAAPLLYDALSRIVAEASPVHDDPRLEYVTVDLDRETLDRALDALAAAAPEGEEK
jgi:hypothetical protein